jgi:hypothetical protein
MQPASLALARFANFCIPQPPPPGPIAPPRRGRFPAILGRAAEMLRPRRPCRRCGQRQVSRSHGLCDPCYKDPQIRASTPVLSPSGRRGAGQDRGKHPPPGQPTGALPGTAEKVEVLQERARNGEQLWHPKDPSFRA